jgi:uncharacterized protein DUF3179
MREDKWVRAMFLALALAAPLGAQPPQRGGPGFLPLREPHFVPAAQVEFLKNDDRVVGVSANGIAKAYPVPVAAWHHIIHDQLSDMPILVTW